MKGKYLLFAVPGSGKTTVIMARTGYLVHSCGVPAEKIMTLTFTRAATGEMRERYRKHFSFDPENRIPAFRTIHSFCFSLVLPMLRRRGFLFPCNVVNATKCEGEKESRKHTQKAILSTVLKNNGVRKHTDETLQEILQTTISDIKNRMMQPAELIRPQKVRQSFG